MASEATSVFGLRMRDNVDLFYVCVWRVCACLGGLAAPRGGARVVRTETRVCVIRQVGMEKSRNFRPRPFYVTRLVPFVGLRSRGGTLMN